MEIVRSENYLVLRLEHGDDILGAVARATGDEPGTLFVTTGIGMIHDFELGYFDNGVYVKKSFAEPHELLSMQGSVASAGEPRIHIHATVANKEHHAFGGHLIRGKVWMSNEIAMLNLRDRKSSRVFDPTKKVGVLHIAD